MDRREFVQKGLGAAGLLAMGPTAALAAGKDPLAARHVVVYDLALTRARQIAIDLPGGERAVGIHGDPTVLLEHVERLQRQQLPPALVTGVTREAAPFCLQSMLRVDVAAMSLQRIDQDLFLWTLKLSRV